MQTEKNTTSIEKNTSFLKKLLIWLITTFFIYVLLATLIMFSRETTLHGVRGFDFKIFTHSLDVIGEKKQEKDLKHITDVLTIKKGQKVFFPVALLGGESCIENGSRSDGLCTKFSNIHMFKQDISNANKRNRYGTTVYDIPNGESYFYTQLPNNKILIGEAGKYLTDSVLGAFVLFLKDDWHNYFLTWKGEPGKYGGITKTWKKTSGIFYLTFFISLILFLIYDWYDRTRRKEFFELKDKVYETDEKLLILNTQFNELMQKRIQVENKIMKIQQKYGADQLNDEEYKSEISMVTNEEQEIENILAEKKEEIIHLEHIDDALSNKLKKKIEKLSSGVAHKELEKLIEKLHNIKKLWQRELTWKERGKLEREITGDNQKIPFTLSQSFILFEKEVVYRLAKKCRDFDENMKMLDMIKLIARENIINRSIENRFHKIRQARNNWMHNAILPNESVIDDLIATLQVFKVEPEV